MADNRFSFSQDDLKNIAEDILKFASKRGASACEVDVSEGFGQSVSVRRDEVDTIEYNRDKGVGVTIYDGQKRGYASTSDFSKRPSRPPSMRPSRSPASPPPTPPPACPTKPCWPATSPTSTSTTRGRSPPKKPSNWPAAASARPSR
jgi:predicted Zn-dependent protease